jgi:hypothetical protein
MMKCAKVNYEEEIILNGIDVLIYCPSYLWMSVGPSTHTNLPSEEHRLT